MMDVGTRAQELIGDCYRDQDPRRLLDTYLFLERFLNDGSPSGFQAHVPDPYGPQSRESATFALPAFECSRLNLVQIGDLPGGWASGYRASDFLPLPVHPLFQGDARSKFSTLSASRVVAVEVAPTASGRTVFRAEDQVGASHFIKLNYPQVLGRFSRDLPLFKWLSALENSREMYTISPTFPPEFAFLHEFGGTYLEGSDSSRGFGVIYRDFLPTPRPPSTALLVPAFSLIARAALDGEAPLLARFIGASPDPVEAWLTRFVRPLIQGFFFLALNHGLIAECNAQNVLYEIELGTGKVRVVLRDLGDMFKDLPIRQARGLHTSFCSYKSIAPLRDNDLMMRRSFAFDFKLGEYVLAPMCEIVARLTGVTTKRLEERVQELVAEMLLGYEDYFGEADAWYAYPRSATVGRNSYERRANPRFRGGAAI